MKKKKDLPHHALPPEKLAEIFLESHRRGWSDGLFVTSGIPKSPVCAMDFFFSSRRRHTRFSRDSSSDVCSSDLQHAGLVGHVEGDVVAGQRLAHRQRR